MAIRPRAPRDFGTKVNLNYSTLRKGMLHTAADFSSFTRVTRAYISVVCALGVRHEADRDILPVSLTIHHYLYRLITLKLPLYRYVCVCVCATVSVIAVCECDHKWCTSARAQTAPARLGDSRPQLLFEVFDSVN